MKIRFDKIGAIAKPFRAEHEGANLEGTLVRKGRHEVALDALLSGALPMVCDRCGAAMDERFEVPLMLRLSDVAVEHQEDLDIIEFLDGIIDIDYIIESELNAMDGMFHFCEACTDSDEILEIEI